MKCPASERVWPYEMDKWMNYTIATFFVHRCSCTCGDYTQIEDYNNSTCCACTADYSFTHVKFVWNVAYVRFFSSWARECLCICILE